MSEAFVALLAELQPSQMYVSTEKLTVVQKDPRAEVEPVPVKELGGRLVLTDGHTRALAAHLAGEAVIRACWEADELDWEAYEICVDWCLEAGIRSAPDLSRRVIPHEQYEVVWLDRCREMQQRLARARSDRL